MTSEMVFSFSLCGAVVEWATKVVLGFRWVKRSKGFSIFVFAIIVLDDLRHLTLMLIWFGCVEGFLSSLIPAPLINILMILV